MKIYANMPLPSHTLLRYEECFAKCVLEDLFSFRYSSLSLIDKPDLISNSLDCGIEVTEAISAESKQLLTMWSMIPYRNEEVREKNIALLKEKGINYSGVQCWPGIMLTYTDISKSVYRYILDCFDRKLKNINCGNYKELSTYELFIICELLITREAIDDIHHHFTNIDSHVKKFNTVYLFALEKIYVFDLINDCYEIVSYTSMQQFEWANNAREMVITAEKINE